MRMFCIFEQAGGKCTRLDLHLLKFVSSRKVSGTQDGVSLIGMNTLLKSFGYGICNRGFVRASLPEGMWATR